MSWQTRTTPIVEVEGGFEAKPPDDGAWEPIGAHAGHVIWRVRLYGADDTKTDRGMVEVLDDVLDESFKERAALAVEINEMRKRHAEALRRLREKIVAARATVQVEAKRNYARGYESGRKKKGQPQERQGM